MNQKWFFHCSFLLICFGVPSFLMLFSPFLVMSAEQLSAIKPNLWPGILVLIPVLGVFAVLVVIFGVVWTFLMRLVYGKKAMVEYFADLDRGESATTRSLEGKIRSLFKLMLF